MHDKLKLLLDQISMNKDCYTYFSNGTLDKISVNKQNESAKFLITLDKILPLDVYDLFHELLARKYNTYYVDSLFNIRNIDYSDVLSYIIYFMQVNYPDDYEETYKELDIEIVNDVIKINGINDSLNEKLFNKFEQFSEIKHLDARQDFTQAFGALLSRACFNISIERNCEILQN